MKTYLTRILKGIVLLISLMGCKEDFLLEDSPHLLTTDLLYSDLNGFETGLNGLYSKVREEKEGPNSVFSRSSIFLCGTDIFCSNTSDNTWISDLTKQWGAFNNPSHSITEYIFSWLYETINAANTIIDRAENSNVNWQGGDKGTEENKNRIIAEAKAIRAWAYRHLTYLYGDVPVNLEESKGSTTRTDWERTPLLDVRKQIIRDLLFAEKFVPVEPSLPGRITKGAVQTYLAEIYLTLNKPDSTIYWTDKAINNPAYKLITERYGVKKDQLGVPYMDMFCDGNANREEGNTESLWTLNFAYATSGGGQALLRRVYMSRYNSINVNGVLPFQITVSRGGRPQSWVGITKFALDL